METRLRVLHCYIHPVLLYGNEAWTITSDHRKRLESCENVVLKANDEDSLGRQIVDQ